MLLSRFRTWAPALSMTLVSLISYIDRNTLALLAPTLLADLQLSGEMYGWVVFAFSIAYMVGNLVWGRWIDNVGLRIAMTAAVSFWSIASGSHAFAVGFLSLLIARTALGFGEGATFPGGLRTVVQTLPATSRARGVAVAYSGGSLGAVITPIVMTPVFLAAGWRGTFLVTGLIGFVWIAYWLILSRREDLRKLPAVQAAERPGWRDARTWSFIFMYAFGGMPLGYVLYYSPLYLRVLGKSQAELGGLLWIPPLGWEIGYFFWGWLTDRFVARSGFNLSAYRALIAALALLSLPLAVVPMISNFPGVMAGLCFATFVCSGFVILAVSYATSVFGLRDSAFLAGLGAGSWSAAVGVVMPLAGRFYDRQDYQAAFLLPVIFPLVGWAAWARLNRGTGLVR